MRFTPPLIFRLTNELGQLVRDVDRVARNLDQRVRELVAVKILTGRHIADQEVTTAGTAVFHGLGRVPLGCIVVKSDGMASFQSGDFDKSSITITSSSGTRTVSLWVY